MNHSADMLPLVTVVTATYKKFDKVFETIQSVLSQDYPRIEYVLCDDGSENFPKGEIEEYIQKNSRGNLVDCKIFASPVNRGTVKNVNHAYKNTVGDFIVNLACGDVFFERDTIRKIVEVFLAKNAKVVVTSRLLYKDNFEPICFLPHYNERKIIEAFITREQQYEAFIISEFYDMASGSAMHFSREVLEEFNYMDENYILWEDGPFLAKYLYKYSLVFAYDIISIWYESGGVSTSVNPLLQNDCLKFGATEQMEHLEELSPFAQKKLKYYEKIRACKTRAEKIKVALRSLPEFVSGRAYRLRRSLNARQDEKYINELIKSSDHIIFK